MYDVCINTANLIFTQVLYSVVCIMSTYNNAGFNVYPRSPVADPDLQIRGGGTGGLVSQKSFFSPSGLSVV